MRSKKNEILDTASSYTKERRKSHAQEKKNVKVTSEEFPMESKMTKKYMTEDLDKRLIEKVSRRVGGVRALYPTDQVAAAIKGIIKSPFAPWIEK